MIITKKIRLLPSEEQEKKMFESANVARAIYNITLDIQNTHYKLYETYYKENEFRKEVTILKKDPEYIWLNNVSNKVIQQAIKDCDKAFKNYFKHIAKRPRFKSKRKAKISFYHANDKLKVKENKLVRLEKIGWIKTSEQLPIDVKYYNPRISYDNKYWYLRVGIEQEIIQEELTDISLGIDLGIKDLAICSNGTIYRNINKTYTIRKIEKRLRRLQRQASRKYLKNKKGGTYTKTSNIIKLEKKIQLLQHRLHNIRLNHLHQTTSDIVKTKPYRIVIEDLNVKGMMKNKHLSKAIQNQMFYEFRRQLEYKCNKYGIELIIANRFYASSKTCSNCGNIKKDLKLKDRVYICSECGLIIDRDLNAAINLSNYELV